MKKSSIITAQHLSKMTQMKGNKLLIFLKMKVILTHDNRRYYWLKIELKFWKHNFWIDIQTEKKTKKKTRQTSKISVVFIYICIALYITHLLLTQSVIKQRNMVEIFVKIYIRWEKKQHSHKWFNMPLNVEIKRKK